MAWSNIISFLKMIGEGLLVSLAPIVAAIGIVVNNHRATKRERQSFCTKVKVELLLDYYNKVQDLCAKYMLKTSTIRRDIFSINKDILITGTSTCEYAFKNEWQELSEEAVILAVYKSTIRDGFGIITEIDSLARDISTFTKTLLEESELISHVLRVMIIYYKENKSTYLQRTIELLKKEQDTFNCRNQDRSKYENYFFQEKKEADKEKECSTVKTIVPILDDDARQNLNNKIGFVINELLDNTNIFDLESNIIEQFDHIEATLSNELLKSLEVKQDRKDGKY